MFTCEICHPGIGNKQQTTMISVGDFAMNLCVSHQREYADTVQETELFKEFIKIERRANVLQAQIMGGGLGGTEMYAKQLEERERLHKQLYAWSKNWLKSQVEAVVK